MPARPPASEATPICFDSRVDIKLDAKSDLKSDELHERPRKNGRTWRDARPTGPSALRGILP